MSDIVNRIFDKMNEKKITQTRLAKELGIKQGTIAGWKKRNCPPKSKYIQQIADILGVSEEWLVTGEEPNKDLTSQEIELLNMFRQLNQENKQEIIEIIRIKNKININNDPEVLKYIAKNTSKNDTQAT